MRSRFASSSRGLATRVDPSRPLSRLQLDINSAHFADQNFSEPGPSIEKSAAALRGESYRGDVELPVELQNAVEKAIEAGDDKPGMRLKALDLYAHLRATSAISVIPTSYRDRHALLTAYDPPTALAYTAGLMPSVFGATVHVLDAVKSRLRLLGGWDPERVVDYGSGSGSGAWAVQEVWGAVGSNGKAREYYGLDASRSMVDLSSALISVLPSHPPTFPPAPAVLRLLANTHQLPIPSSKSTLARLHLSPNSSLPGTGKRTLALCSFMLGDLGTKEKRREVVRALWDSGAEVIVLIDRGTPAGSRMILEAREQLLVLGKRSLEREPITGVVEPERGSFVLAPCPHDGACPLHNSTSHHCHFSQRVRSPAFLRHTKHSTRGEDDAKFSYVVIQRGIRPTTNLNPPPPVTVAIEESEADPDADVEVDPTAQSIELEWPRLVAPPMKRSGHVILEVCAASGLIERHTIPKSQGKQAYYDSRKVRWGDTFPHPPKNGVVLLAQKEEKPVPVRFGASKKAERIAKEPRVGRRARGMERESDQDVSLGNDFASLDLGPGAEGDAGGVREYTVEIVDGQLKIMD